jgi:hypothetical protein
MADLYNILMGSDQEAQLDSGAIARAIRGNRQLAAANALGAGGLGGLSAVQSAEAKQDSDLAEKALTARAHYTPQRQEEAALQEPAVAQYLTQALGRLGMPPPEGASARGLRMMLPTALSLHNNEANNAAKLAAMEQANYFKQAALTQKQQQTPDLSQQALDMAAHQFAVSGDFSKMGNRALAQHAPLIINRAAELYPDLDIAGNSGSYKARQTALNKMEQMSNAVQAFERTASKNMDMLEGYLAKIPDSGASFLNRPLRAIAGGTGDPNMSGFMAALLPVQSEAARILSTANLAGQLTDESRREMQKVLDPNATGMQIRESIKVLRNDFANRMASNNQQIAELRQSMSGRPQPQQAALPGAGQPAPAAGGRFTHPKHPGKFFDANGNEVP